MNIENASIIKLRKIQNFSYRRPVASVDEETGEVTCELDENDTPLNLGNIYALLNFSIEEEFDESGNLIGCRFVSVEPINIANAFLVETALNGTAQDVNRTKQHSDALRAYFQFLADEGLGWDKMPAIKRERPPFLFKRFMEESANINVAREHKTKDPLAISTVKAYMRHITSFYKYLILKNYSFDYPPFDYEEVSVTTLSTSESGMSGVQHRKIITTDLRITAKSQQNEIPNHLRSMTPFEWEAFDTALRIKGFGLRKKHGQLEQVKNSLEVTYQILIMRYSGCRREEVVSLRKHQIFHPSEEQFNKGYIKLKLSPTSFNTTKNDKERIIEIPSNLMLKLFEYTKNPRYRRREKKYRENNPNALLKQTPLFINSKGAIVTETSLTSRFAELRNAVVQELGQPFDHKTHNLRATYAVFRIREYANAMISIGRTPAEAWDSALDYVKNRLGHESVTTTYKYLKQAQDDFVCAAEKAEDILEFADSLAGSKFDFSWDSTI